jgi:hypothetical protein
VTLDGFAWAIGVLEAAVRIWSVLILLFGVVMVFANPRRP